jgi:hypothetical protein
MALGNTCHLPNRSFLTIRGLANGEVTSPLTIHPQTPTANGANQQSRPTDVDLAPSTACDIIEQVLRSRFDLQEVMVLQNALVERVTRPQIWPSFAITLSDGLFSYTVQVWLQTGCLSSAR